MKGRARSPEIRRAVEKVRALGWYREMYELTNPECGKCRRPHSCCDAMYCEIAEVWARDQWGVTLKRTNHPTLPFMGLTGCTVEPHLRPMCTLHTCDILGAGAKPGDEEWTKRYFTLRDLIDEAEFLAGVGRTG